MNRQIDYPRPPCAHPFEQPERRCLDTRHVFAFVATLAASVVWTVTTQAFSTTATPADLARYLPPPGAPYDAQEVRVRSFERHSLGGTITLPILRASSGMRLRFPAVVLVGGRSTQDRDGAALSPRDSSGLPLYRPFYDLADTLSRRGIVTLRLDDPGVGASTGSLDSTTTFDRSYDTRAAIEFLRKRPEVDARRIAIVGMSEGATIAGMIAMLDEQLGPIVLMGPPSATGREIMAWQHRGDLVRSMGANGSSRRDATIEREMAEWDTRAASDRWLGFFATYDPLSTARRIAKPVLVLQGDADRVVPPEGASKLTEAFRAGGSDATLKRFPDLDHAFLRSNDFIHGAPVELSKYRMPAEVRGTIAQWLATRLGPAYEERIPQPVRRRSSRRRR